MVHVLNVKALKKEMKDNGGNDELDEEINYLDEAKKKNMKEL